VERECPIERRSGSCEQHRRISGGEQLSDALRERERVRRGSSNSRLTSCRSWLIPSASPRSPTRTERIVHVGIGSADG